MLKKTEELLLYVAGFCIVGLGTVITLTVILRNLFNTGVPDVVTIVGELMMGGIFLPLAYVTRANQHIAIDFLFNLFGKRVKLFILLLGSLLVLAPMLLMVMASWGSFSHALASGSYFSGELELPEWPGRLFFFVGLAFFYLRLLIICFHDTLAFIRADEKYLSKRTSSHDVAEEA